MEKFDPSSIPIPQDLLDLDRGKKQGSDETYPVEFLSNIFSQKDSKEVLQISKDAKLPMWLNRKVYYKLKSKIEYD
jgi:hypothetical protein